MASPILLAAACLATNLNCAAVPSTTSADDGLPRGRAEVRHPAITACSGLGPGYVWAPASDTCVKVGGYVRVDGAITGGR